MSDFTSHMRRFCPRVSRRVALPRPTWVFPHGPHGFWRYAGVVQHGRGANSHNGPGNEQFGSASRNPLGRKTSRPAVLNSELSLWRGCEHRFWSHQSPGIRVHRFA